MRYIVYCRKSSESAEKQTLSIDSQKRGLMDYAAKHNLEIVDVVTEAKSAYKVGRPVFNSVVDRVEQGEADALLVWHLSRIARNSIDGGRIVYLMDEGKLKTIVTPHRTYEANAADKFMLQVELSVAKKSSDDTSDWVRRDIKAKLLKGEYPMDAPIGYLNISAGGAIAGKSFDIDKQKLIEATRSKIRRVEKDPIISPLVQKLLEEYSTGKYTLDGLAKEAYKWGLRAKRSKRLMRKQSVRRILENPFYYGKLRVHGQLYDGDHDKLISKQLYDRNQEIIAGKAHTIKMRYDFAFKGILKCGQCGYSVIGETKKGHTYYRCSKKGGNCEQPGVREEVLFDQAKRALGAISLDQEAVEICIELLKENLDTEVENGLRLRQQWQKELNELDRRSRTLLDMRIDGDIDEHDYRTKKAEYSEQRDYLKQKLDDNQVNTKEALELGEQYFLLAQNASKLFEGGNLTTKKELLSTIGWNLTLKDKQLDFHYAKPWHSFVHNTERSLWRE